MKRFIFPVLMIYGIVTIVSIFLYALFDFTWWVPIQHDPNVTITPREVALYVVIFCGCISAPIAIHSRIEKLI